jgi:hypothetical protein
MRMADASDTPTSDAEWPPEFHKKFRAGTDWPTGG